MVALSAPTMASVVTIRLVALALAARVSNAAAPSRRRRDMGNSCEWTDRLRALSETPGSHCEVLCLIVLTQLR
ncbi:Gp195 [Pseudomonas sp. Os17]|nr:Gp195 [Pseudomonas sp. Os17]